MQTQQEQLDQNIKENWFAGIGVRKPYTVFVCIMAIIILGVFAFSKMSVDLFPSMNLPYAVVVLSPNQSYMTDEIKSKLNDYIDTEKTTDPANPVYKSELTNKILAKIIANAAERYDDQTQYAADVQTFQQILAENAEDPTAMAAALTSAAGEGNKVASYYLEVTSRCTQKMLEIL